MEGRGMDGRREGRKKGEEGREEERRKRGWRCVEEGWNQLVRTCHGRVRSIIIMIISLRMEESGRNRMEDCCTRGMNDRMIHRLSLPSLFLPSSYDDRRSLCNYAIDFTQFSCRVIVITIWWRWKGEEWTDEVKEGRRERKEERRRGGWENEDASRRSGTNLWEHAMDEWGRLS